MPAIQTAQAQPDFAGDIYTRKYLAISGLIHTFIRTYWLTHGYSPCIREITLDLSFSSTSVTKLWLKKMRDNGHLLYKDGVSRSFRLPGQTVTFPALPARP
jgi:hypothetical protein